MLPFVAAWSGGEESANILELEACAKQLRARKEPEDGQFRLNLAKAEVHRTPRWPMERV